MSVLFGLESLIFLVFSIPTGFYSQSDFSSAEFPDPWEEGFDRNIPFRTECSKVSHPLHKCLAVGLYLYPFPAGGSFSDDV